MNIPNSSLNTHKCNDCGSSLILMEVTTGTVGNNPSPITKSTYRCSNKSCQEEADKRTAESARLKLEQVLARERRKLQSSSQLSTSLEAKKS